MILITGGAGYVGSHANKTLTKNGYKTLNAVELKILIQFISCDYSQLWYIWGIQISNHNTNRKEIKNVTKN